MNKIGFNVLAWSAAISDDLLPIVDRLQALGYDGVEMLIGSPEESAYKRIGSYLKNVGLDATTVFVLGKDENPVSESPSVRSRALDKIKWAIDRAHDLNATILAGPYHSAHGHFMQHAPEDEEYERSSEVLRKAGEHAQQAGVILALEAVNRFECYLCNTMEQLKHLVTLTDHPSVQAMFDTHHGNIEEKNFQKALEKIAPHLVHVHISENDRGTPGEGQVRFDDAFSNLKRMDYKGWLTIEAFSRNDPAFANAIGVWREFSKPWDIAEYGIRFIREMCVKHGLR